ncbi:MAG: D-sedoheptulose 7-phosphate isomerase [Cytophagales bacterium]|nr:D-sedoheptulose 7-phosphate isomerase [Cytophagales bacterium]
MNQLTTIIQELEEAALVLTKFVSDKQGVNKIADAANMMSEAIQKGHKIIACGNGGSHCDAMHFAEELTGKFRDDRKPLPAIAISDPSYLSCTGNDYGFSYVFSRFVQAMGQPGDILLAISTSGHSENVVQAAEEANRQGMQVVALTGNQGGKLRNLADIEIRVPHYGYADRIQEVHIKVIHALILLIEKIV